MYFIIWVLMIMVYDCFAYQSLCIQMLKIKWNGLLKRKEKKKTMTKKKSKTMFLDLRKEKKKKKRKEKKIK